jgi:FkbM family methyltransferase
VSGKVLSRQIRSRAVYALHRTGAFRVLDDFRDHVELLRARQRPNFSQYGEDSFLLEYFKGRKGFYIDIGANHPVRGSNTYQLYRAGWQGLVVEPIRWLNEKHRRFRPRDVQVNALVGRSPGEFTFYEMIPSVLSTCDADVAREVMRSGLGLLLEQYPVPVVTVADLYRTHMAPCHISLLCVDTEGHDLAVLQGNDWDVLRPEIVVCEANDASREHAICRFLGEHGYSRLKTMGCSMVFIGGPERSE